MSQPNEGMDYGGRERVDMSGRRVRGHLLHCFSNRVHVHQCTVPPSTPTTTLPRPTRSSTRTSRSVFMVVAVALSIASCHSLELT